MKGLCYALAAPGHESGGPTHTATSDITVFEAAATTMGGMFTLLPFMARGGVEPVVELFLKISKQ